VNLELRKVEAVHTADTINVLSLPVKDYRMQCLNQFEAVAGADTKVNTAIVLFQESRAEYEHAVQAVAPKST
jgi:hypothetical protein